MKIHKSIALDPYRLNAKKKMLLQAETICYDYEETYFKDLLKKLLKLNKIILTIWGEKYGYY